jgi:hypothetical protein
MIRLLLKLGCYASVVKPIKKYSLELGVTLILSNILFGVFNLIDIYFVLKANLIVVLAFYFSIFILIYILLVKFFKHEEYCMLIKSRESISKNQNILYQFILMIILLFSVACFFSGMILGSELR